LPAALRGVRDAAVHAVAGRHSADRRVHGQVLVVQRGDRVRLRVAGGDRRAQQRRLALLLHPYRRLHVPAEGDDRFRTGGQSGAAGGAGGGGGGHADPGDLSAPVVRRRADVGGGDRAEGVHGGGALSARPRGGLVNIFTRSGILP